MPELTYRPLQISDAPGMLEISLAAEQVEPADDHVDLIGIEEAIAQPGIDLPHGSVAVTADGALVGFGYLYVPTPGDRWNAHLGGGVLPEFRRRGIGRAILARLMDQSKVLRNKHSPDLPGRMSIWLPHGRLAAAALADESGFRVMRYFFHMRAALDEVPAVPAVDGIEIHPWSPEVDEGTRLAYNASFADHWGSTPMVEARWRSSFADASAFRPAFSRVALERGEVVGFVMVDEFAAETEARGYRTAYVDRVGSIRAVRGRGIAAALVAESMGAAARDGCRYADLTVDADSPTGAGRLYERLGYSLTTRDEVVGLDF